MSCNTGIKESKYKNDICIIHHIFIEDCVVYVNRMVDLFYDHNKGHIGDDC